MRETWWTDRHTAGGGKEKSVLDCGTALFLIHFKSNTTYRNMYLITDVETDFHHRRHMNLMQIRMCHSCHYLLMSDHAAHEACCPNRWPIGLDECVCWEHPQVCMTEDITESDVMVN